MTVVWINSIKQRAVTQASHTVRALVSVGSRENGTYRKYAECLHGQRSLG